MSIYWTSVSEGRTVPGGPVSEVVRSGPNNSRDNGQRVLFVADPNGGVYTAFGAPESGWSGWTSVSEGSTTPGAPITALAFAVDSTERIALFVADPKGGVYTAFGAPESGWSGWTSVSDGRTTPGGTIAAVNSIVVDRANDTAVEGIALFLADPNGGVYTAFGRPDSGWTGWTNISEGSTTPGAPITALSYGPSDVGLFVADPKGGVYTAFGRPGSGWSGWTSVSDGRTTPGGTIAALSTWSENRFIPSLVPPIALFLADPNGGVYTVTGDGRTGWGEWTSISEGRTLPGAPVSAALTAAELATSGSITVVLADPSGAVYNTSGSQQNGWRPWTSVAEGRSTPGAPIRAAIASQTFWVITEHGGKGNVRYSKPKGQNLLDLVLADPNGGVYLTCIPY